VGGGGQVQLRRTPGADLMNRFRTKFTDQSYKWSNLSL
jgi:hypothetical protein